MLKLFLFLILSAHFCFADFTLRQAQAFRKKASRLSHMAHKQQSHGLLAFKDHLEHIDFILMNFGYSLNNIRDMMIYAVNPLHDILEDTDVTFTDLVREFNIEIANRVNAVTLDKDLPRDEGFELVFQRLKQFPEAIPNKVADRIANIESSLIEKYLTGNSFWYDDHYKKEWPAFKKGILSAGMFSIDKPMWDYLVTLMESSDAQLRERVIKKKLILFQLSCANYFLAS